MGSRGRSPARRAAASTDRASGQSVAFIVCLAVVAIGFAFTQTAITNMIVAKTGPMSDDVALDDLAQRGLDRLLGSPGLPKDWHEQASADVKWAGLLVPQKHSTIDLSKLIEMKERHDSEAAFRALMNRTLGLPDGVNWRLEVEPVFEVDKRDGTLDVLSGYRGAYIGAYSTNDYPGDYRGASESEALDTVPLAATKISFTPELADYTPTGSWGHGDIHPSDRRALSAQLALRLAGFAFADDEEPAAESNSYWRVVNTKLRDFPGIPSDERPLHVLLPANGGGPGDWSIAPGRDRAIIGPLDLTGHKNVRVEITHHVDGEANPTPLGGGGVHPAYLEYYCISACEGDGAAWTLASPDAVWTTRTGGGGFWVDDTIELPAMDRQEIYLSLTYRDELGTEGKPGWLVRELRVSGEDVRGDNRETLYHNSLDYTVSQYDVIVLQSKLSHATMDDRLTDSGPPQFIGEGAFINAFQDWVAAGGDVVSLGSARASDAWLPSRFDVSHDSLEHTGSVHVHKDALPPVATVPARLRVESYSTQDSVWRGGEGWSEMVTVGEAPAIMIRNRTTESAGAVALTIWALDDIGSDVEQRAFLGNVLAAVHFRDAWMGVNRGPAGGGVVASHASAALLDGSDQGVSHNPVRLTLFVWR